MQAKEPTQIVTNKSGTTSWTSDWISVRAAGYRGISMLIDWAAAALTAGTLSLEGTDHPTQAKFTTLTVTTSHGTFPAVSTSAANATVILENCPAYVRIKYTQSAGGAASQFNAWATLSE